MPRLVECFAWPVLNPVFSPQHLIILERRCTQEMEAAGAKKFKTSLDY